MVCEGYYEWKAAKTKKDAKQPYYIYATQEKGVKADDLTTWKDEWSEEGGWKGFKLLKMAGIFNKFKTAEVCSICKVDPEEQNSINGKLFRVKQFTTAQWLQKIPIRFSPGCTIVCQYF